MKKLKILLPLFATFIFTSCSYLSVFEEGLELDKKEAIERINQITSGFEESFNKIRQLTYIKDIASNEYKIDGYVTYRQEIISLDLDTEYYFNGTTISNKDYVYTQKLWLFLDESIESTNKIYRCISEEKYDYVDTDDYKYSKNYIYTHQIGTLFTYVLNSKMNNAYTNIQEKLINTTFLDNIKTQYETDNYESINHSVSLKSIGKGHANITKQTNNKQILSSSNILTTERSDIYYYRDNICVEATSTEDVYEAEQYKEIISHSNVTTNIKTTFECLNEIPDLNDY